jgi:hypothetical protein
MGIRKDPTGPDASGEQTRLDQSARVCFFILSLLLGATTSNGSYRVSVGGESGLDVVDELFFFISSVGACQACKTVCVQCAKQVAMFLALQKKRRD